MISQLDKFITGNFIVQREAIILIQQPWTINANDKQKINKFK